MASPGGSHGRKLKCTHNTEGKVNLRVNSDLYKDSYMKLDKTAKNVLDTMFVYIDKDTNLIQIGGETLDSLCDYSGLSESTVRKALVRLQDCDLVVKSYLKGEYQINPRLAYKGDEREVWRTTQDIEHKGEIPESVNSWSL